MMILALQVFRDNDFVDGPGMAFLYLDKAVAQHILSFVDALVRINKGRALHSQVYAFDVWDNRVEYVQLKYEHEDNPLEEVQSTVWDEDYTEVDPDLLKGLDPKFKEEPATEINILRVTKNQVRWTASLKYNGVSLDTASIPVILIRSVANAEA